MKETREILDKLEFRYSIGTIAKAQVEGRPYLTIDEAEAALDALIAEKVAAYTYDKRVADNCRMVADNLGASSWLNPMTNRRLYNEAAVAEKVAEGELKGRIAEVGDVQLTYGNYMAQTHAGGKWQKLTDRRQDLQDEFSKLTPPTTTSKAKGGEHE